MLLYLRIAAYFKRKIRFPLMFLLVATFDDIFLLEPCVLRRSRSYQSCRNPCVRARCPANPAAICKPDCFCVARFYNPITFEKVDCKKSKHLILVIHCFLTFLKLKYQACSMSTIFTKSHHF